MDRFKWKNGREWEHTLPRWLNYTIGCHNVSAVHADHWHYKTNDRFDVVFVDGNHHPGAVAANGRLAKSVLRSGGVVAFHDYRTYPGEHDGRWDAGVTQVVDEFIADGWRPVDRFGTVIVLTPP